MSQYGDGLRLKVFVFVARAVVRPGWPRSVGSRGRLFAATSDALCQASGGWVGYSFSGAEAETFRLKGLPKFYVVSSLR